MVILSVVTTENPHTVHFVCDVSAGNHVTHMTLSVSNETNDLLNFNGRPLQFQIEIN